MGARQLDLEYLGKIQRYCLPESSHRGTFPKHMKETANYFQRTKSAYRVGDCFHQMELLGIK